MFDDMFHGMFVIKYDVFRDMHCVFHVMVGDRLPEISFVLNQAETGCRNSDEGKRRRSRDTKVSYVRVWTLGDEP
jgi:hypothetical protein